MKPRNLNYILGLDLGIASVGWSVVEIDENEYPIRLIDVGVRTFERAEVPKTGESLALARRLARSTRRLIRRRAFRLLKAKRLLKHHQIVNAEELTQLPNQCWELRVKGLDSLLSNTEWAAVLLHLLKHRGYLSQRKNEAQNADKELGKLREGMDNNSKLLLENNYRTPADIAVKKFAVEEGHMRNQRGAYTHTFNRLDILAEMQLLFKTQRELGSTYANGELEQAFCELLLWQKQALNRSQMLSLVGKCTFEKEEKRAAKASYSAERFVAIQKLQNLRILENGEERGLFDSEFSLLLENAYNLKSGLTYKQVRKILSLSENAIFKGLPYLSDDLEKPEKTQFLAFKFYHQLADILKNNGFSDEWQKLSQEPTLLDKLGTELSLCKEENEFIAQFNGELPEAMLSTLFNHTNFDKFIHISLKALNNILPLMEQGNDYTKAWRKVYPEPTKKDEKTLPPIPADEIRNPVVLRSLSQARKVINAVIRLYGSPARIHIETARELGKSYDDRQKIKKQQDKNSDERDQAVKKFLEECPNFANKVKGKDILKIRLYINQDGKCLYSGKPLDPHRLLEIGYVEIDHALPFSRTWDDSQNNKVLVLANENQNKGNQTPFEWLGKDEHQWALFVARVNGCRFPYAKKQRILTKKLDEQGFLKRNLNDTRYVSAYLMKHIKENLHLVGKGSDKVFASNGQVTNFLRRCWGLEKKREEGDRHHALDAIVVACSTASMRQKITLFKKYQRWNLKTGKHIDQETGEIIPLHFPAPWDFFRQEVMIRIFSEMPQEDLIMQLPDRPQANHEFVQPLFVSRAPSRKMSGQGHEAKLRSARMLEATGKSIKKEFLTDLTIKNLEHMVNKEREPELYQALVEHFKKYGDKPKEKFFKKGGVEVKSIRISKTQNKSVNLGNKTIADNGDIVRTDLFLKNKKYYFVNIYAWQVSKGILPKETTTGNILDNSYEFQFSLFKNDLLEIPHPKNENDSILAYFIRPDDERRWILKFHDNAKIPDIYGKKDETSIRLSIQGQKFIKKYQVDELGKNIRPCRPTKRQGVR
ncbi:CRISPR-associated protein, Csn1 [Bibersteinia trehalosi USDA-ARS-USMARC-188]|uniref:CRISPR-associated endonuclease Cas9 n=1 Tax=Bibersteinia trehalosi USDA-ARS-USMARC-188 TaxID=1263829 RepID=A0A4V7IAY5_BIBTR|nr:type II CRISPR RNA-guided endonuclease Cas9 [Bibersteinia trehalosi]AGH38063.1 CRISPR-associated protein, Csn1 [Bibersteinia trehalosi USDA-ARS-USMARC-192]AHG82137.1 CRISPR-associated protein, Csn1 [Bibersteinia trehalosi USDA-ARS-USMARC-188]